MGKTEEITGVWQWEVARFTNGDGPDTVVGRLEDQTTVRGCADGPDFDLGLCYRFYGRWIDHPKYGRQFAFSSYTLAAPYGERGTVRYLARPKGIGPRRARQIWALYGPDSLETVRERPEEIARAIKGITLDTAYRAQEYFKELTAIEATTIELTGLLADRGFPKRLVGQLIARNGAAAVRKIREDPYSLLDFHGVGFLRTDALYLELGKPADAPVRQACCVHYGIQTSSDGYTWLDADRCLALLRERVSGARINLPAAIWEGHQRDLLARRNVDGQTWIADQRNAANEASVAACLRNAAKEPSHWPMPVAAKEGEAGLTTHQAGELAKALGGLIGISTGSPGTGKTFSLASLIAQLLVSLVAQVGDPPIAVCAPTGKAAVRCTESLASQGIHLQATTTHRLLGVETVERGRWGFRHNHDNPLPFRYIINDESSMDDVDILAALLDARAPGTHILFVGDPNQLPPVGHGAPLRDMIAAGLPCGRLTELHRHAGRIAKVCREIQQQHKFTPADELDLEAGENLIVSEKTKPDDQIKELQDRLEALRDTAWHPAWDTYVLCAVNSKSPLCRQALNGILQDQLNGNAPKIPGGPFRVGDKIINLKNSFLPAHDRADPEADERGRIYVANGDIGEVLEGTESLMVVRLGCPDRTVRVPRGQADDDDGAKTNTGCNWDLAYAITTHKSQGSQAPWVFPLIDEYPGARRICKREWLYTAFSRAETACVAIGRYRTALEFCRTTDLQKRKTFLRELIQEEL